MSLKILCSAKYIKTSSRMFDKITEEYDPPSYWFRLKILATGKNHSQCNAQITNAWTKSGRGISGVDPIQMFWLSEPTNEIQKEKIRHFAPDIIAGKSEILGLAHIKIESKYRNPNIPIPDNNTPANQVPEVKLDRAKQENTLASKKMTFPYGTYFIEVQASDQEGESVKTIFKITTGPCPEMCSIRTSRWYERVKISTKSVFPAMKIGTGLKITKNTAESIPMPNAQKIIDQIQGV